MYPPVLFPPSLLRPRPAPSPNPFSVPLPRPNSLFPDSRPPSRFVLTCPVFRARFHLVSILFRFVVPDWQLALSSLCPARVPSSFLPTTLPPPPLLFPAPCPGSVSFHHVFRVIHHCGPGLQAVPCGSLQHRGDSSDLPGPVRPPPGPGPADQQVCAMCRARASAVILSADTTHSHLHSDSLGPECTEGTVRCVVRGV